MSLDFLSISDLAKLTKKDRRTVSSRLESLSPSKVQGKAVLYSSLEALTAIFRVDFEKSGPVKIESSSPEGAENSEKQAKARIANAKAEKIEMELDHLRGELVKTSDILSEVEKEYTRVRTAFRSLGPKNAKQLSVMDKAEDIAELLHNAVNEILTELSADDSKNIPLPVIEESEDDEENDEEESDN